MSWKDLQFTGWFGSDFSWMYWSDPNRGANVDVLRNKSGVLYDCDCHKCEQTMCWHVLFRWRSLTSQSRLYLQNLVHRHLAALAIRTIERAIFWSQSFKWLVFLLPLCYRNLRLRNGLKYATGANATAGFFHRSPISWICFWATAKMVRKADWYAWSWYDVKWVKAPANKARCRFELICFLYHWYQSKIGIRKVGTASNVYDCTWLWWFDHVSPGHGAGSKWASWVPQQADKFAKKMGKAAVDSKGQWVNENAAWQHDIENGKHLVPVK